ncbi:WUSCHEL-related homeobox 9-like [Prosopis cineraria]|uniref:WUSCHEL-related homeobox 9-like n=1 Tax=Prosopis cineraria TaxID=364024 RepID=UPI0024101643|nr:WUSCHEL-related homeobox 9-like [Prosopis cineraria]
MASSNRHWPSMFKSKPCNPQHPWQHDMNSSLISSSSCHRTPYTSSSSSSSTGCEERSPEPKPRWNPKPEQIRILEAIFNSGMVNPPRDEIRKIRAQLQEYGQVGDANVFYWFQNRKSRSKHKLRNLQNSNKITVNNDNNHHVITHESTPPPPSIIIPQISSPNSSSSDNKSSPPPPYSKEIISTIIPPFKSSSSFSIGFSSDVIPSSPSNHHHHATYFQTHNNETSLSEPFFFPVLHHNDTTTVTTTDHHQGFCFSELSGLVQAHQPHYQNVGPCTSLLLSEMMNQKKEQDQKEVMKNNVMNHHHHQHHHPSFCVAASSSVTPTIHSTVVPSMAPATTTTVIVPSLSVTTQIQEEAGGTAAKSIVHINDVAFEVAVGPFNVREAFGDDAVLVHAATGHPVLTNEWGVTLQSLSHGAFYYLI